MNNKSQDAVRTLSRGAEAFLNLYKIDPQKPVTFLQQLVVMGTVLLVSCMLFTVVYIFQSVKYGSSINTSQTSLSGGVVQTSQEDPASQQSTPAVESSAQPAHGTADKTGKPCTELFGKMTAIEKTADDIHTGPLILVNKDYSCRTDGENVESLMGLKTGSYLVSDATVSLDKDIIDNVNDFFDAFESLYGETDVMMACGYRSYYTQVSLFNQEIYNEGEIEAENWVAPPGYSEHQTGYVFDLDLNITGESGIKYNGEGIYSWLNENCGDYGFTLRYKSGKESITGYSYEPWHFRYVGLPHSVYMEDNYITYEEYLDMLHNHTKDNVLSLNDHDGGGWCVYYVPGETYGSTSVPVPQDHEYTVSGDNVGGFIVTVKMY